MTPIQFGLLTWAILILFIIIGAAERHIKIMAKNAHPINPNPISPAHFQPKEPYKREYPHSQTLEDIEDQMKDMLYTLRLHYPGLKILPIELEGIMNVIGLIIEARVKNKSIPLRNVEEKIYQTKNAIEALNLDVPKCH